MRYNAVRSQASREVFSGLQDTSLGVAFKSPAWSLLEARRQEDERQAGRQEVDESWLIALAEEGNYDAMGFLAAIALVRRKQAENPTEYERRW